MNKNDFKIGQEVDLTIYDINCFNERVSKKIHGKVVQLTDKLIVLDNNKYKESYSYTQLIFKNKIQPQEPYQATVDDYKEDIVNDCIKSIKQGDMGFVYSERQLCEVKSNFLDNELKIENNDGIYELSIQN